jgi:hypothetical protein
MDFASGLKLQSRLDDFSYQVSADNDRIFWFRLEREPDRDVITDFLLGSISENLAATALIACYGFLRLTPRKVMVFRNILPSYKSLEKTMIPPEALDRAQHLYATAGKATLIKFGARKVDESLESRCGKYDLVLWTA